MNPMLEHHGGLAAWLLPFNQLASDPILHWLRYTICRNSPLKSCGYCLRPTAQIFSRAKPARAFMNNQEPDLNPTPAETDSAKTNESVQREGSELPVDQRSSYLRSRQIALKKFSPQGGDPS